MILGVIRQILMSTLLYDLQYHKAKTWRTWTRRNIGNERWRRRAWVKKRESQIKSSGGINICCPACGTRSVFLHSRHIFKWLRPFNYNITHLIYRVSSKGLLYGVDCTIATLRLYCLLKFQSPNVVNYSIYNYLLIMNITRARYFVV